MLLHASKKPIDDPQKPRIARCSERFPKVRRQIHKAFFCWYHGNAHRFKVPLRYVYRTDRYLEFTFHGLHPYLSISLTDEIGIHVTKHGIWWDALRFFEVYPQRVDGGYQCALCNTEAQETYATLDALWRDHLFEPFLAWVNDTLVPARYLGIYGFIDEGATWARLLNPETEPPDDDSPTSVVPVWLLPEQQQQVLDFILELQASPSCRKEDAIAMDDAQALKINEQLMQQYAETFSKLAQ